MNNYLKSEFEDENYKSSKLAEAVKKAVDDKAELFLLDPYFFGIFPRFIRCSKDYSKYYSCMDKFKKDYIDSINNRKDKNNTSDYLRIFISQSQIFGAKLKDIADKSRFIRRKKRYNGERIKRFIPSEIIDVTELAQEMVKIFQILSAQGIFNNDNNIMTNYYYRHYSKFLPKLICPDEVDKYEYMDHTYYFFNIMDPFVCAAALRIMNSFSDNKNAFTNNENEYYLLSHLRRSMFIRLAEKEFTRHFYINGMTYKATLNNEIGGVVASPFYELSSIDDFKPIRLFEKIVLYIIGYLKNKEITTGNKIEISISIIGHTEPTYQTKNSITDASEYELNDLVEAIIKWWYVWSNLPENKSYIPSYLNVNIDNYYHTTGITSVLMNSKMLKLKDNVRKRHDIYKNSTNDHISITVSQHPMNFEKFEYNYNKLKKIIEKNNLIFLIDCPFLFEENYKLRRAVSFRNYCERINKNAKSFRDLDTPGIDDPENRSNMDILSNQFNRLMATGTKDTGDICRVFRESWFKLINEQIKNSSNDKLLYLYSSERFGINYSKISLIPLSRVEHYDKKSFNIYQFSANDAIDPIEFHSEDYKDNNAVNAFYISLWSTLKYSSIEFAYTDFKKSIVEALGGQEITDVFNPPIEYFMFLNNVFTKVTFIYDDNTKLITVNVSFAVSESLEKEYLTSEIKKIIVEFIRGLYEKVYFRKKEENIGFADAQLKNGFIMNLYNSALNVDMINYWHQYRIRYMYESENEFKRLFEFQFQMDSDCSEKEWEEINMKTTMDSSLEYFNDKRLYDLLLLNLEKTEHLGYEINIMLERANNFFNYKDKAVNTLLTNIIDSQKKIFKGYETKSYENAKKLL